ncbi:RepA protein, partial [Ferrithrix thermotolerans DSM 19514]
TPYRYYRNRYHLPILSRGNGGVDLASQESPARLRDQVTRLATSTITITDTRVMGDGVWNFHSKNFGMIDEADLWWSDRPTHSDTLWPNTITISPAFRDLIKASSVPLDTRGLALIQQAKAGPLALDLYTWLAHRMFSLCRTTTVPWTLLSEQFGSQYAQTRQFKAKVIKTLPIVHLAYPEANVLPSADGLVLKPWPLPVARKIVLDA